MTINLVLALTIGVLFAAGVYLMLSRNLIRVILGFLLAGHGDQPAAAVGRHLRRAADRRRGRPDGEQSPTRSRRR